MIKRYRIVLSIVAFMSLILPMDCDRDTPDVGNTSPDQPSNISPTNGTTDESLTLTLQSSIFSDSDIGDAHTASQWQITNTQIDYSDPVYDSGTDTTNKSSVTITALILDTGITYYWRVKHQDLGGNWSDWSTETSFTTSETVVGYLFDTLPTEVMPVVYISGTEYEMGYQYGQQVGSYLQEEKEEQWASLLAKINEDDAEEAIADMAAIIEEELTDIPFLDIFEGMADGAQSAGFDVTYQDVLMCNFRAKVVQLVSEDSCSWIATWDEATNDGKTIVGGNYDFGSIGGTYREVAIVAYPDNGNAFVTYGRIGKLGDNFIMNDKGLVIGANKSSAIRDEDIGCGVSDWNLAAYIAMTCSTAEEARDVVLDTTVGGGKNILIADENGDAYAVEYTAAMASFREPGDFGEQDYLITTNHFLNPEMEPAQGYVGSPSDCNRYLSLKQSAEDNYGEIDTDVVMDMITAVKLNNTLVSKVAIPEENTIYLCNGSPGDGQWASGAFGPTGQYIKIQLGDSVRTTVENVKKAAGLELRLIEEAQSVAKMASTNDKLELLRDEYKEGIRYFEQACSEENISTAYDLFGKASIWFAEVQAGAKYLNDILT